ncbi:MAG: peptidoglycan bridge formation glycyltransferase FemA/FemB family protein [Chloroflexota bacterium]|nr:peptidoglycan bridge formation glycyltransferase FemA/FemB family protein [Chloroflexota bacterium]
MTIEAQPVVIESNAPADWDDLAVDRPGGHVLQSRAWAAHWRASGWRPLFLSSGDQRILALVRDWPLIGGGNAYLPRGPVPVVPSAQLGASLWAVTKALAGEGIDVVAADPEVPAADATWRDWLRRARFQPIEELQASRHRISLALGEGADEEAVFKGIAKSTRQRIRKAEKQGIAVVRHDTAGDSATEGFAQSAESAEAALDRFYDLLLETGERRNFTFGTRGASVAWWRAALAAGHLVYLEARDEAPTGQPLAGLILYRHGGRLSTVHSGDLESSRRTHPGALHLLRWRSIQLAIRERRAEMDLGGADVAGARREPIEGEPMHGLYQHKLSFGGQWLELAGAHERVIRPNRYRAGRLVSRGARAAARIGSLAGR